jgi:lipopolysaccharide/colanic/teichoic acid biosynthesis glycosyltransferase
MLASKLSASPRHRARRARWALKSAAGRAVDFVLATSALALTLPLILCIALLIVLDDPGPVLVSQRRAQVKGRQVTLLRFRTHRVDPDGRLAYSKIGSVLHRTGLEDIPMLINIAGGQLPVIGRYTWRQFLAWLDSSDE